MTKGHYSKEGNKMELADIVDAVDMCLTEVKGQIADGGNPKEAIRQLLETVQLLDEMTDTKGGD